MRVWAADFETNNSFENNTVWAWGLMNIEDKTNALDYGNTIESFIDAILKFPNKSLIYFHNLKFDGTFIVSELINRGFKYDFDHELKKQKSFYCIIDDMNQWYKISIRYRKKSIISIQDSAKKIPMGVADMPGAFGIDTKKGNLDDKEDEGYQVVREKGHLLTPFEVDYLKRDVVILKEALKFMYDNGLTGMTIAGDAMKMFQKFITKNDFDLLFPVISYDMDEDLRKAYRGGWTYCLKNQTVGEGLVFDVNSLYPSVLYSETLGKKHLYPIGVPEYFKGKYVKDKSHPLFIQHFKATFVLKEGYLPFLQKSSGFARNSKQEYITEQFEVEDFYMTNVDLELFKKHYKILTIEYVDGYKMQGLMGMFDEYIDHFIDMKIKNNDNPGLRTIAKLYLNSLYGKFGMSKIRRSKFPEIEDDKLKLKMEMHGDKDYEMTDGYRVDVAAFCTAYAREVTLTAAQECHKHGRFCYADTDSIHITGLETPNIHVHRTELGAWKNETVFKKAKFIRAKTYCEFGHDPYKNKPDKWDVKCAGMSKECKEEIVKMNNFPEIFDIGFTTDDYEKLKGKLRPIRTKTGTVLVESSFSIK